ncbi:hypothetical protein ACTBEV_002950 [Listeria monocytogenes]|nr:hypothetical protein [Listeria monocytogenes]
MWHDLKKHEYERNEHSMNWESLIPTIIGGLLALLGGIIQQNRANKTAEKVRKETEKNAQELRIEQENKRKEEQIRQDKIGIIKDIASSKTAILNTFFDDNAKTTFNGALNLIPVIFQDNKEILNTHQKLFDAITTGSSDNSNNIFYELVMLMHDDVGFERLPYEQFIRTLSA